ncbi:hypothetical protein D9756_003944 [Leucocoprinus leucothites]|uniref:DNA mismatch repair protein n=1 Tax=Leucocoprinus leucothites TaxID=201217 RepID=A0A8H5DB69_9AGAR|nr:hypothetical protein D9756_003944 [Leucoagaricus leucothites]
MVLSRSILRRAKHADLNRLLHNSESQKTRYIHVDGASASSASTTGTTKKVPQRSRKKIRDLPQYFTLPDGTPAKPLGDYRHIPENVSASVNSTLNKDIASSSCLGDTAGVLNESQDTSGSQTIYPMLLLEDAPPELVKSKRTRKPKAPQADVAKEDPDTPIKRTRRSKKAAQVDAAEYDEQDTTKPRTILAQEIQDNLRKFPHCLLLTRVGQFYESYFDQAEEIAHLLNIKLTSRKWGGSRVPMCGFPLIHLDKHLKVLVQQNKRFVAMCEEFPRKEYFGAKEFERRVARIITPGTLIDEPFLNAYENNFLLAISAPPTSQVTEKAAATISLAWIDVSTGEFYSKNASLESVQDELARINPREVVLPDAFTNTKDHPLMTALAEENCFLSFIAKSTDTPTQPQPLPTPSSGLDSSRSHHISLSIPEQAAVDLLTSYLNTNLLESMPPLTEPIQDNTGRMQIDAHTIKALEIRETDYEGSARGSLFSVIKRTITNGGTRLLSRWLCSPSTSLAEITARQSLVEFFVQRPHLAADMTQLLCQISDTSRLTQKFLVGRGDPSDLATISRTIRTWSKISAILTAEKALEEQERENYNEREWASLDALVSRMHTLQGLSETIDRALGTDAEDMVGSSADTEPEQEDSIESAQLENWKISSNRWRIKPEFSKALKSLHAVFQRLLVEKEGLETRLRLDYVAPSLTLRASPSQGMHVHLARKRDQSKLNNDSDFVSTYESGSTKCYFNKVHPLPLLNGSTTYLQHQEWSHLGNQIIEIIDRLTQTEKDAFDTLRNTINEHAFSLRRNSEIIDELDVALSFAKVASELKFVKPKITEDNVYDIVNGRHPSVEIGLLTSGRVFTPNSTQLHPDARLHVITGPNMAGKSTFLRQTALISILAQIGSFVPADAATIGLSISYFQGLEQRTIYSGIEVIMDEVGRGTTVNDGLAIAFATVHHLTTVNQCRTLFATHFHELAYMLGHTSDATGTGVYQNVHFYCTDVDETDDGYFAYSYRLRPGVNWDSHGLKVAQLAGLPDAVIEVASDTLDRLKRGRGNAVPSFQQMTMSKLSGFPQPVT